MHVLVLLVLKFDFFIKMKKIILPPKITKFKKQSKGTLTPID